MLVNFDSLPAGSILPIGDYGGTSGRKNQAVWRDSLWMIKYPEKSNYSGEYDTTPIGEWLGSHVYESLGIPVQETILGKYKGEIVVACKHIYEPGEMLLNFGGIMQSWAAFPGNKLSQEITHGCAGLNDIHRVIHKNPALSELSVELEERFWDMFVVDTLVGNSHRDITNWGVIQNQSTGKLRLAPVYANSDSFCSRWTLSLGATDDFLRKIHNRKYEMNALLASSERPFRGNNGLPLQVDDCLRSSNPDFWYRSKLDAAMRRIVPQINLENIFSLVDQLKDRRIIWPETADLYKLTVKASYELQLFPYFQEHCEPEQAECLRM